MIVEMLPPKCEDETYYKVIIRLLVITNLVTGAVCLYSILN